ncbi:MAG TPA: DEAD/DEAH box helicase, partial [Gemmataceae bacterium]|nr:DEAD/DEAH box helicase [Gemmataceae bacterium]
MIILHGAVADGHFLLWGETPAEAPAARRGRKPKAPTAGPFPYDPGAARLAAALPEAPAGLPDDGPVVLWLPTAQGKPVPSSPLIAEVDGTDAALAPWAVTTLPLTPAAAVGLLCECADRETLRPGVIVGPTLAFWAQALRFAGALVAREQFVPDVRPDGKGWRACWRPVLAGADGQRAHQLAGAMPAACRALSRSADAPPDRPASALLTDFLGHMVDALVRPTTSIAVTPAARTRRGRQAAPAFDSVHDRWLHALQSSDGALGGKAADGAALAEQVRAWQRPLDVSAAAPFRLCFRLEEPPATDGEGAVAAPDEPWQVRYLLQALDDPSLLVPATEAWKATGRVAQLFKGRSFDAREYLLTSLGQAAGLCPAVESSLKAATPDGFSADARGAHGFLTETAWLLEQAGFGVLLPAWWTRKGTKQRLSVRAAVKSPKMQGGSGLSLNELVKFDWKAALGEHELSLKELEELARLKAPLVRVRGQWVQVSAEEIQAALDFWKKKGAGEATLREVVRMALGGARAADGLEVAGVSADGWVADFLGQLEGQAQFEELAAPPSFHGTLRPYQVRGYSWLAFLRRWGLGACLADDMGLGKTVQTLALVQRDWETNRRPTLLVCPTSVVGNWQKEAQRFTPELPVLVHHGLKRARGAAFEKEVGRHALVLSSYALLHRDQEALAKVNWAGVVLDEAQNVKNPETKQSRAARALKADYRVALTGTPVENHVGDLWSILEFLNPGLLGTQAEFRRRFFVPIQAQHDAEAAGLLKRLTGPFVLRR